MDQGKCIKFCVKYEIKYARIFEMLTVAYDQFTMCITQVQLWYNWFKRKAEKMS